MNFLKEDIPRSEFLRLAIKAFAITALSFEGVNCGNSLSTPTLKGISSEEYFNMRSMQEIFLEGNPIPNFDLGK
ncbi:MAG TPA: hypothetical protein PLM36_12880, partial [Leptospiraceae bacterium]|nr:hypothetical protein [Leptospiraceae bacterium]